MSGEDRDEARSMARDDLIDAMLDGAEYYGPEAYSARELCLAEDRGYRRAIEALRDDESYRKWENANNVAPAGARSHVPAVLRDVCADYLGWLAAAPRNEGAQT